MKPLNDAAVPAPMVPRLESVREPRRAPLLSEKAGVDGLTFNDAQMSLGDLERGLPTLTSDYKTLARKVPQHTELDTPYGPR